MSTTAVPLCEQDQTAQSGADDVALSPRIARLKQQALAAVNEPDPTERGWAVMKSYDDTAAEPMPIRRATAVAAALQEQTLVLDEGDLLAGRVARHIPSHPGVHEGFRYVNAASYPDLGANPYALKDAPVPPEFVDHLREWSQRHVGVHARVAAIRPENVQRAMSVVAYQANGVDIVHRLPRFEMILERGADALRQEAGERLAALDHTRAEDVRKRIFYRSIILAYEAMIAFAERWAEKLDELADAETDPHRRAELHQIAAHCRHVPAQPPRTFWEALQAVWLIACVNQADVPGSATSFGRFDQYLYRFYQADIEAGRVTRDEALELLQCFFLKCYRTFDFHYTTLGGQEADGSDATNALSYLCLDAVWALRTPRDVGVRIHRGTPPEFFRRAAEIARIGLGRPDFWNDEVVIEALTTAGLPIEDAREYAPIGCVEVTIPGKCNSRTMGHAINLAKILEITLNGGRCALTGEQVGIERDPDFLTYEALHAAYREQAARYIRDAIEENVRGYVVQATELPFPVLSALTVGCMESGRDVMDGGALYSPAGVNLFGIGNVADGLAALKRLVYEESKVSLAELREALLADFEGYESLQQMLISQAPKYGNDDPYVDDIAAEEAAFYCGEVAKYPTPEGNRHHALLFGCTPASVHHFGPKCGASADGRRAREPLATSVNPSPGRSLSGATAELNSVARIEGTKAPGGVSYILDLHPSAVDGPGGLDKLVSLLRTFFDRGGTQIGLNVLREDRLRKAQAKPRENAHIMVRVFGFSTQFVSLDPDIQEYVIRKTKQTA